MYCYTVLRLLSDVNFERIFSAFVYTFVSIRAAKVLHSADMNDSARFTTQNKLNQFDSLGQHGVGKQYGDVCEQSDQ